MSCGYFEPHPWDRVKVSPDGVTAKFTNIQSYVENNKIVQAGATAICAAAGDISVLAIHHKPANGIGTNEGVVVAHVGDYTAIDRDGAAVMETPEVGVAPKSADPKKLLSAQAGACSFRFATGGQVIAVVDGHGIKEAPRMQPSQFKTPAHVTYVILVWRKAAATLTAFYGGKNNGMKQKMESSTISVPSGCECFAVSTRGFAKFTLDAERASSVCEEARHKSDEELRGWLETECPLGKEASASLPVEASGCCAVL